MTLLYIQEDRNQSMRRVHLRCDSGISDKCLKTWSTRHLYYNVDKSTHVCRNCNRKQYASVAGKAAAEAGKTNGQIQQWIMAATSPEARDKARRTSRSKGRSAFTSKVEDAVYEKCLEWFTDVKRWHYITRSNGKRCSVDLYVPSNNTWIEVDGAYWHGLDRPYEQLGAEQRGKFDHDRLLDEHCRQANIRLVRVTDREVKAGMWDAIHQRITR